MEGREQKSFRARQAKCEEEREAGRDRKHDQHLPAASESDHATSVAEWLLILDIYSELAMTVGLHNDAKPQNPKAPSLTSSPSAPASFL